MSVHVDGLAGRSDSVELEFDRHTNIIWGLNGSGKTTLLKIIHAALNNDSRSIRSLPFRSAVVRIHSIDLTAEITRSISMIPENGELDILEPDDEVVFDPDFEETGPRWATEYSEEVARGVGRLHHSYLSINRLVDESRDPRYRNPRFREAIDDSTLDDLFARQVTQRWQAYFTESLSRVRDIQQQGLGQVLSVLFGGSRTTSQTTLPQTDVGEAFEMTRGFLRSQNIAVNFNRGSFSQRFTSERNLQEVVGHIRTIMENVDEAIRPQVDFAHLIRDLYSGSKQLAFDSRGIRVVVDGDAIPLSSLSSGERQILHILLQALSGGESSVIIDEPEISLHVDWQERLVESMRIVNPDCQLILATHSPEVMANVADTNIHQI
ncbi:ATP-binding protein [Cellulomonas sp. RIT-PI-Y]|uniref:AAA family ATPase n=1 Tax=Cellulomonas sp. RIT-PI-Y TaxID=3035297 RepID=UPI0021DA3408|nr:ATP-binding protein [Cellulomonas sp. RIT-PI-Y]